MTHKAIRTVTSLLVFATGVARLEAQESTADSAWAAGDFHGARIGYERALADDSTSVRALYRLGVLASWDGKLDSSLTLLGKARSYEPGDPDVRIAEARVLSWKGDYKGSVQHYDSVLADHPDNREAGLGRAQVLGWAGKYREADQQYALLMSVDPRGSGRIGWSRAARSVEWGLSPGGGVLQRGSRRRFKSRPLSGGTGPGAKLAGTAPRGDEAQRPGAGD